MPKILEMYAFVVEDTGPDDEGVVALQSQKGSLGVLWLPLVGADMRRVESLKPIAAGIGKQLGKEVKLIHFTTREDLGVVTE